MQSHPWLVQLQQSTLQESEKPEHLAERACQEDGALPLFDADGKEGLVIGFSHMQNTPVEVKAYLHDGEATSGGRVNFVKMQQVSRHVQNMYMVGRSAYLREIWEFTVPEKARDLRDPQILITNSASADNKELLSGSVALLHSNNTGPDEKEEEIEMTITLSKRMLATIVAVLLAVGLTAMAIAYGYNQGQEEKVVVTEDDEAGVSEKRRTLRSAWDFSRRERKDATLDTLLSRAPAYMLAGGDESEKLQSTEYYVWMHANGIILHDYALFVTVIMSNGEKGEKEKLVPFTFEVHPSQEDYWTEGFFNSKKKEGQYPLPLGWARWTYASSRVHNALCKAIKEGRGYRDSQVTVFHSRRGVQEAGEYDLYRLQYFD